MYILSSVSTLRSVLIWKLAQASVWLLGAFILYALLFSPDLGLLLFWNILIPVAPLIFVVAPGVWRNVCPLATTTLLPRHLEVSRKKKLTASQMGAFNLVAVIALYVIVPLRHAVFNHNGMATGLMIMVMALIGILLGLRYEWKSVWCSGLCPVHPVEKLYGANTLVSLPNAHCTRCQNCVIPCPDSTPNITPRHATKTTAQRLSGWLLVAGLPGFIWGWFHVLDVASGNFNLAEVYAYPFIGALISGSIYFLLNLYLDKPHQKQVTRVFAAAGVSIYYFYRIPALLGFGNQNSDGLLVNLQGVIPAWLPTLFTMGTTLFFCYWLVVRKPNKKSWLVRPAFAVQPPH